MYVITSEIISATKIISK